MKRPTETDGHAGDDVSNDSRRILAGSTAAMVIITITCAALCFALLIRHSHDLQRAALSRELRNQAELISSELADQRYESERVMSSLSQAQVIAHQSGPAGSAAVRAVLGNWADRRLPLSRGLQAIDVSDVNGRPLLQSGSFGPPPRSLVHLDADTLIGIGSNAHIVFQRVLPRDESGRGAVIKMQFALPRLTAALLSDVSNDDFNTAICQAPTPQSMQCLQLTSSPLATLPSADAGPADALTRALSGKRGVVLEADSNGTRVLSAFGPIEGTPLVMTLTTPLDAQYGDLRQRLNMLVLLMAGLVAVAAWILRRQIAPLIAKVVAARSRAKESAMHLAAIMDTAGDGIVSVNRVGTVLLANPAFKRLLGSGAREILGENLTGLLPGLELQPDEHGQRSLAHLAERPAMEYSRQDVNGEPLHLQVEFAWLDPNTRSTLVATVRDLTLLKRREMQLRETHERLQASEQLYRDQATRLATLFDSVEDAIVVINASGNIESWNRGAQHLFGYSAEEIVGKDARLLLPESHASQLSRYLKASDRIPTGRIEMEARHGGGRIVPIEVSIREMMINGQQLHVAVMHDISVRREVERMKSEFIATISHELRTPLTSIAGSLTLISGGAAGETPPKIARLVGIARQNSERLIRLINDILDLEKAEAGKLDFALGVRSLRAEVASVAEFNRGYAQSLGVAIALDDGDDADVLIDSDRLTQVMTNLISNAAKFSPPGGVVRIRIDREGANVRVTVSDQGPGIPEEFCERIFHKFAQADASDSRAKGGTGLGLSIAKTITEKLGGRIGFDTQPGKGTSFYILLPIHGRASTDGRVAPDESLVEVERTAAPRGETMPQILHVEDDQSLTAIVREALSRNAHVTSARSLAAARQQLAEKHFDAMILDVALPDGSGLDLLPVPTHEGKHPTVTVSYTADEPSRSVRAAVDAALVKSRHSVTQLMVTVLAQIEDADRGDLPRHAGARP